MTGGGEVRPGPRAAADPGALLLPLWVFGWQIQALPDHTLLRRARDEVAFLVVNFPKSEAPSA